MNVTLNVIHDLLPAYAAGEASADTVALVDEFLRQHPDLAATVEALRAHPLPPLPATLPPTQEKEALNRTKRLLRWRNTFLSLALFLSLVPFSFRFDGDGFAWTFPQEPPAAQLGFCLFAILCWTSFFAMRRRLRATGL